MKHINSILFILAIVLLYGCKGAEGPQGPAGPALTGTISGVVILRDLFTTRLLNAAGVTVTLDGTSYTGFTDSLGKWSFHNIVMGTYDITYSKAGYSVAKTVGQQFIAGGGPGPLLSATLYQLPDYFPDSLSVYRQDSATVGIRFVTQGTSVVQTQQVRFFFGITSATSSVPLTYYSTSTAGFSHSSPGDTVHDINFSVSSVTPLTAAPGTVIYVRAYSFVTGSYTDRVTGWTIYSGLSQRYSTTSFQIGGSREEIVRAPVDHRMMK